MKVVRVHHAIVVYQNQSSSQLKVNIFSAIHFIQRPCESMQRSTTDKGYMCCALFPKIHYNTDPIPILHPVGSPSHHNPFHLHRQRTQPLLSSEDVKQTPG